MSKSLVRKALELLEEDLKYRDVKIDSTAKSNSNKQLTKKNKASNQEEIIWKSRANYKKDVEIDRTEENVLILKELSKLKPKPAAGQKVLEYQNKILSRNYIQPEEVEPEPESILFPEENKKKKRKK